MSKGYHIKEDTPYGDTDIIATCGSKVYAEMIMNLLNEDCPDDWSCIIEEFDTMEENDE